MSASANAIVFDEDRSARLTYEQLAQTMELGDGFGDLPKSIPRQSGELISEICQAVKAFAKVEPTVADIIIREPYCQANRKRLKSEESLKLEDYAIRRLVARIDLPQEAYEGTKDHMNASICLTYINTDGQKGIQVGFGENVHVCENRTIFGGFQFSTYGPSKVGFEDGMQLLNHWLQNLQTLHDKHIAVIDKLMKVKVARGGYQRIVGSLFEKAIRFNNGEREVIAPLNQTQVGDMVRRGIEVLKEADIVNGWEMLNWGTSVLKAEKSDMTSILQDTANFNSFLLGEFKIEPDFALA